VADDANTLQRELRMRLLELEALNLEVRHLQADLQVKDEYIAALQRELPATPTEVTSALRYLAARARLVAALRRHPVLWRLARGTVHSVRRWRAEAGGRRPGA
jgi:ABC-type phosphate transport system auxiliary subunit